MPDDIDELSPKAFLTRPQLVRFLNKLCAPARGEGPPAVGTWAKRTLYDREQALEWARSRMRSAAHET